MYWPSYILIADIIWLLHTSSIREAIDSAARPDQSHDPTPNMTTSMWIFGGGETGVYVYSPDGKQQKKHVIR